MRTLLYILLLLSACTMQTDKEVVVNDSIQKLDLSRKFSGNMLKVTASGVPPLIVSLHKDTQQVFYDFLERSGSIDINILPFRKDFGRYELIVEDILGRDTSIMIQIDKEKPTRRRNTSISKQSRKKQLPLRTAKYIKGENIGGREKETFYCPACDEYITIYYGTRAARTAYVHKEFPGVRNNILHLAGKQFCELKCKKKLGL